MSTVPATGHLLNVCDCRDPSHSGVHMCDYCTTAATSNTVDDNEWENHRACEPCHDELTWLREHTEADCDPTECDRDHAAESREAHAERLDDMRREDT